MSRGDLRVLDGGGLFALRCGRAGALALLALTALAALLLEVEDRGGSLGQLLLHRGLVVVAGPHILHPLVVRDHFFHRRGKQLARGDVHVHLPLLDAVGHVLEAAELLAGHDARRSFGGLERGFGHRLRRLRGFPRQTLPLLLGLVRLVLLEPRLPLLRGLRIAADGLEIATGLAHAAHVELAPEVPEAHGGLPGHLDRTVPDLDHEDDAGHPFRLSSLGHRLVQTAEREGQRTAHLEGGLQRIERLRNRLPGGGGGDDETIVVHVHSKRGP